MGVEITQDIAIGDGVEVFEVKGEVAVGRRSRGDVEVEKG